MTNDSLFLNSWYIGVLVIFPSLYDAFAHEEDNFNINKTVLLISLHIIYKYMERKLLLKKKLMCQIRWVRLDWWWRTENSWQTHSIKQCLFLKLVKTLVFGVYICTNPCAQTYICTHVSWPESKQSEKESMPLLWGLCTKSLTIPDLCFLVY